MTKNDAIVLKLYKDGMVVFVNQEMPFEKLKRAIREKFENSGSFFQGVEPNVGFKGVALTALQKEELIKTLSEILKAEVTLWENPSVLEKTTEEKIKDAQSAEQIISNALKIDVENQYTKFYNKTMRSGQLLESEGHIVIIGDINPGAEVVAAGNIFVMGNVKGTVHAGAKGNREAVVVGLNLSPTQLRIADIITRSPDGDVKRKLNPEIAYIKDNGIIIEDFLQKKNI